MPCRPKSTSTHSADKKKTPACGGPGRPGGWWASDGLGGLPPLGVRPSKIVIVAVRG